MSKSVKLNTSLALMFMALFRSPTRSSSSNSSSSSSRNLTTTYTSNHDQYHHYISPIEANEPKRMTNKPSKKIGKKIKKLFGSVNTLLFSSRSTSSSTTTTSSSTSVDGSRVSTEKKTVRFSLVCSVVGEDSCVIAHLPLKRDGERVSVPVNDEKINLEFRRHYVQIQKEFFSQIDDDDQSDYSGHSLFELPLEELRATSTVKALVV